MVLKSTPEFQGIRFLVGLCIVALSVYLFYLSLTKRTSPELFLSPVSEVPGTYPCRTIVAGRFTLCLPSGFDFTSNSDGSLRVFSSRARITGEVRFMKNLPREEVWRRSLHNPLIRAWLGDERSFRVLELMTRILESRYNPTLMGVKAKIIPPWMKNSRNAEILTLQGNSALIFYTSDQLLGLKSEGSGIIMLSFLGTMDKTEAAGIIQSVRIIPSA